MHTVRDISTLRTYFIPLTICDLKIYIYIYLVSMLLLSVHFRHEEVDWWSYLSLCVINGWSLKKEGIIGHVVKSVGCSLDSLFNACIILTDILWFARSWLIWKDTNWRFLWKRFRNFFSFRWKTLIVYMYTLKGIDLKVKDSTVFLILVRLKSRQHRFERQSRAVLISN